MKKADLEQFKQLQPNDAEGNWKAIETLFPHLNDHLLLVEEYEFLHASPCRLVAFHARNPEQTSLYAMASYEGRVFVGKTDALDQYIHLDLADFDPRRCEIVTLCVSGQHHFMGEHLHLWVAVVRFPPTEQSTAHAPVEHRVYHALVGVDATGKPLLRPAQDDALERKQAAWDGATSSKASLPVFLTTWNMSCAPGLDPFEMPGEIKRYLAGKLPPINAVQWVGDALCYTLGKQLTLVQFDPASEKSLVTLGEQANCLALAQTTQGNVRGLAGCEDRHLVCFVEDKDSLRELWRQELNDFPLAMAVFEQTVRPTILLVNRNGYLQKFDYIEPKDLLTVWRSCWSNLGLIQFEQKLPAVVARIQSREKNHSGGINSAAYLYEVLRSLFKVVGQVSAEQRAAWLDQIDQQRLFALDREAETLPKACMDLLVKYLKRYAQTEKTGTEIHQSAWLLPDGSEFVTALLHRLYVNQLSLDDRQLIDWHINSRNWSNTVTGSAQWQELSARAGCSSQHIWSYPPPKPGAALDRQLLYGNIALEYWTNPFINSATRLFQTLAPQDLVGILAIGHGGTPHLLVTKAGGLELYDLQQGTVIDRRRGHYATQDNTRFVQVVSLRGTGERLCAVLTDAGAAVIFSISEPGGVVCRDTLTAHPQSHAFGWVAASCPAHGGGSLLVIAGSQGQRARLSFYRITGDEPAQYLGTRDLSIAWLSCMDVARCDDGYILGAATDKVALSCLVRLEPTAFADQEPPQYFSILRNGTLCIRFDKRDNPSRMLVGGYSGMLWCADLSQDSASGAELCWTYRLQGSVRAIETVDIDGEPHFLLGSEKGELCLLTVAHGRRRWKEPVFDVIRHLALVDGVLTVAMREGRVKVYEQLGDGMRDEARKRIEQCLADLQRDHAQAMRDVADRHYADHACIQALYRIKQEQIAPEAVLGDINLKGQQTRARIVRYLAEEHYRDSTNTHPDFLKALRMRELGLWLTYADNWQHDWPKAVWKELKRREADLAYDSSESRYLHGFAVATCLRTLAQNSMGMQDLLRYCPDSRLLEHSIWVRLEYARLLAQAALRDKPPHCSLLAWLLPHLLGVSPALVYRIQAIFVLDSENQRDFHALNRLLNVEQLSAEQLAEILEYTTERLRQRDGAPAEALLSSRLTDVHQVLWAHRAAPWVDYRRAALRALQALNAAVFDQQTLTQPVALHTLAHIRAWLLNDDPLPDEAARLEQRLAWVEKIHRRIEAPINIPEPRHIGPWHDYAHKLLQRTRAAIQAILTQEHQYLLGWSRPYLELHSYQYQAGGKLAVVLRLHAEGYRPLEDVTVNVDAGREDGLLPPGRLQQSFDYLHYPFTLPPETVNLHGFVRPGQQRLKIRTSLQAGKGFALEEDWYFDIPEATAAACLLFDVPQLLPEIYAGFKAELFKTRRSTTLVVFDAELGGRRFLQDWDAAYPLRRLDVDALTQDIGPGRRYNAATLSLDELTNEIGKALEKAGPLLLAPLEQWLQRLLDGEAPGVLDAFCRYLSAYAGPAPLLVCVSSEHASHLRRLGLGPVAELAVHAACVAQPAQRAALCKIIAERGGLHHTEAERHARSLGYDLRWVGRWLHILKQQPSSKIETFFAQTDMHRRLTLELQALTPINMIQLLAGTKTETQLLQRHLRSGMVAARAYKSTTRGPQAKTILKAGIQLTSQHLTLLNTEVQPPPTHVWVQGFCNDSSAVRETGTRLYSLLTHLDKTQCEQSRDGLCQRGFATQMDGVFRTASPYRELILACYLECQELPDEQRDAYVYARLLGAGHFPLEAIDEMLFIQLSTEQLKFLMPSASSDDLKRLKTLADLWAEAYTDKDAVSARLQAVFAGEGLLVMPAEDGWADRWDQTLWRLNCPTLGLYPVWRDDATVYPQTYVLWLPVEEGLTQAALHATIVHIEQEQKRWMILRNQQNSDTSSAYSNYTPRMVILGPGCKTLGLDANQRWARLRFIDVCRAAWEGGLLSGLWRLARLQLRLTASSPFKTGGALPPGSPVFRGREKELAFLQQRCRAASILLIGARRVGKTSLLNQFRFWARQEPDLAVVYLDLQGVKSRDDFINQFMLLDTDLVAVQSATLLEDLRRDVKTGLWRLAEALQQRGKLLLFLFNEVDGVAVHTPELVEIWRGLNDAGLARFIMSAYMVIGELNLPTSGFFHFTEGTDYDSKAIVLGALSDSAAHALLDLLETSDLHLCWRSAEDKTRAYALLLQHSYRIPWVLQNYGRLLVEHLEEDRRDELSLSDVEKLLAFRQRVVWQYIEKIDYGQLGYAGDPALLRCGFFILLYAVARQRYFAGGSRAPIRDANLSQRRALDFGFSAGEVVRIVGATVAQLPLIDAEKAVFLRWFEQLQLSKVLCLLTLTLILEPDPYQIDRYGFLMHIFPLELYHQYGEHDPTLEDVLLKSVIEFLGLSRLSTKQAGKTPK